MLCESIENYFFVIGQNSTVAITTVCNLSIRPSLG